MYGIVLAFLLTAGWSANHFASVLVLLRQHQDFSTLLLNGAYGIYALGLYPTLILGGLVADRVGAKPAVITGTLIVAAGNAFLMLVHAGWALLAGRFVVGLGVGLVVSAGTAWAGWLRGASGTTAAGIALTMGFMLGPVASGIVAQLASGAIFVPFLLPILMSLTVTTVTLRRGGAVLPPAAGGGGARSAREIQPSAAKALATAVPMGVWVFASITTSFVVLAPRAQGVADIFMPGVAALIGFSVALAVQTLARRGSWGPATGIAGALSAALGMGLVAVGGDDVPGALFVVATMFLGLGYGLCLREGLLDVDTFAPPASRGRVIGLYYVATYLGFGLPPLTAWLTPRIGPSLPFAVLAVLAVCSAVIRAAQLRSRYLVRP